MDDGSKPPLASLIILLAFSAYLAFVETALASASRNRIKNAAEHGDKRAERALKALDNFENAITSILIANNITSVSIATIVTVYVTKNFSLSAVTLSTVITTIVIYFACEMLPKSIAKRKSYEILLSCATLLSLIMFIFKPLACVLSSIGEFVAKHTKEEKEVSVTEDELQDIIEDLAEEGAIDEQQGELISSALDFGDIGVNKILTRKKDITAVSTNVSEKEIINLIKSQSHSRIPVYEGSLDNIVGVLNTRRYMKSYIKNNKAPSVSKLMNKVYYAPQSILIHDLLPIMSKKKINMAVITDDNKKTIGIVTVEDILEELVGDIEDESDSIKKRENKRK